MRQSTFMGLHCRSTLQVFQAIKRKCWFELFRKKYLWNMNPVKWFHKLKQHQSCHPQIADIFTFLHIDFSGLTIYDLITTAPVPTKPNLYKFGNTYKLWQITESVMNNPYISDYISVHRYSLKWIGSIHYYEYQTKWLMKYSSVIFHSICKKSIISE